MTPSLADRSTYMAKNGATIDPRVTFNFGETIARCRPTLFLENDTAERSREVLEAVESIG